MDFLIREYKKTDYPQIIELWEKLELASRKRGDNQSVIENTLKQKAKLFVIEFEDKIIGTSWITNDGRRLYLHHFGIDTEFQGYGLSKPLLKESLDFVKEVGLQIKLEVHKENFKAINLYRNSGFSYLGDYKVFIIREF
ncbi:MAG: GNAT family N-acetyltransferase [Bacteroidota bacterium]|nr:GNAT family N-acetyltransferase [Bacteroidota bacterium]